MITCVELTPQELLDLVSAVFEYNGRDVASVELLSQDEIVTFDRVRVKCEDKSGLSVRVVPGGDDRSLQEQLYPEVKHGQ